jgi:hypothetical protein
MMIIITVLLVCILLALLFPRTPLTREERQTNRRFGAVLALGRRRILALCGTHPHGI